MTEPIGAQCPCLSIEQVQASFLQVLSRIETHAQVLFRHVRCPGKRDDAIAEVVALAWKWHRRLAEQGKDSSAFVTTLATLAARHVRCGRKLSGQEKGKDAFSPLAQTRHGFTVQALPSHETGTADNDALDALAENTVTPPPEQAAFRIDYPAWLSGMTRRNRTIAQDMALGHTTKELAAMHQLSQGRISQLRREFHLAWQRFHGEVC